MSERVWFSGCRVLCRPNGQPILRGLCPAKNVLTRVEHLDALTELGADCPAPCHRSQHGGQWASCPGRCDAGESLDWGHKHVKLCAITNERPIGTEKRTILLLVPFALLLPLHASPSFLSARTTLLILAHGAGPEHVQNRKTCSNATLCSCPRGRPAQLQDHGIPEASPNKDPPVSKFPCSLPEQVRSQSVTQQ